jgi:DNA repair protein RecO (recombination protein O)
MSRTSKSRALVLNTAPRGEKDRLIELFTPGAGLVFAAAYGVRKPGSRFGALLEPGTLLEVILQRGKTGFMSLGECTLERSFAMELDTLEGKQTLLAFLVLLRRGVRADCPDEELFSRSLQLLQLFAAGFLPPGTVLLLLRLLLLSRSGSLPVFPDAEFCGKVAEKMALERHGISCTGCMTDTAPLYILTGGEVRVLALLAGGDVQAVMRLRITAARRHRLECALDQLLYSVSTGT